ncbi:hypothetical protein L6270_05215 [Candidatus Parcubacteria bacterium]|nr:hypothetical protein [Patescibacteria group bacterium]MBU4309359.1 hypothetical protein [Patescibacteria group bacterium]MBU4432361.1 hypothetical protein [Patescibacteria group bacterium]MBU4577720.1 hypothetical protein [Patescibacteria group bacterium]MCG2697406.1 hypothetical protein [Candidatus Parcubacteria bacterium]
MHDRGHLSGFGNKKRQQNLIGEGLIMDIGNGLNGSQRRFMALVKQQIALKRKLDRVKQNRDPHQVTKVQYHLGVTDRKLLSFSEPAF